MIGLLIATLALGGELFVNDVQVNPVDLQGMTLEKVDVTIDATGNIRIKAPGYKIQIVNPTPAAAAAPAPAPAANSAGYYPPGAYGQPHGSTPPAPKPKPSAGPAPLDPTVPPATWWLVSEDNGTTGHTLEVYINGRLAQTLKSGETQRIVDVGAHVKHGANTVTIKANSASPTGGSLYVYVGTGSDRSGTVVMDEPAVQFGVGKSKSGPQEKSFQFTY